MHARELAELAAIAAIYSPVILRTGVSVPVEVLEQYWTASKCRLDRWSRVLRQLSVAAVEPPVPATLSWARVQPVLEEVLLSELLTRIWAALATAHDAASGQGDLEPIARNILTTHLDVRRRLLAVLANGRVLELPQVAHLDQLRRRVERWGDMLLAHLAPAVDISEFAFEPDRARDFAEDLQREAMEAERQFAGQLILASLRGSFASHLAERTPNSDLNRRIGLAVLNAIREHVDESSGIAKSAWLERMTRMASDTEGMIEELLRL
jgi:hypothetical protein